LDFFEKASRNQQTSHSSVLYVVDITWVKHWKDYIHGHCKPPGKISNKKLYEKYYVNKQQIQLSKDFYFFTEELWKFLFAIYGGGPIMKKETQTQSNNSSQKNIGVQNSGKYSRIKPISTQELYEKEDWDESQRMKLMEQNKTNMDIISPFSASGNDKEMTLVRIS